MKNDILKILGQSIRDKRNSIGLSREQLSKISKLHINYISDVERGTRNISIRSLEKIAKALKVDFRDLFPKNLDE